MFYSGKSITFGRVCGERWARVFYLDTRSVLFKKNLRASRLIFHDSTDREEALQKHLTSKEPTVLVTPSMSEGVDLRDDLARFQVLVKVPYPSLGDKLVKKRMNRWSWWYPMQTIKTIVQSVGRGVRSGLGIFDL